MTNKLKYFIGNWKMFGDYSSIKIIKKIHNFRSKFNKINNKNRIIICVPNTLINFFTKKIKSRFISIGAQNCHFQNRYGPFTGSVSSTMLKKVGAKYVILGHSENRNEGDTNQLIEKKIKSALKENMKVIFCFGETANEKRSRKTFNVIRNQINTSIKKNLKLNNILFAYEPVWSIGTGKLPTTSELKKTFKFIKNMLIKKLKLRKSPIVLYGGSVNENNIKMFSLIDEIDGFLIGGASQSPKKFIAIIKNYYK